MQTPSQTYPIPAVRAIIENQEGKVLILQRANSLNGSGQWCLPGGKVDYGQTIEEALAREIAEELSVTLTSSRFFFHQDSLPPDPGGPHYINFYYHCSIDGNICLNQESMDFRWIGLSELSSYSIVFRNEHAIRQHFSL